MNIGWLCPFVHMPGVVVGCIVEAYNMDGLHPEYIPVILPETPIGIAIERGPLWVCREMTYDMFAFKTKIQAEGFLYDTLEAFMNDGLSVREVERLLDVYQGEPHTKDEYGIVWEAGPHDLN